MIGYLLGQLLARSPDTSALVRSTAAVTLWSGGTAQNVLPQTGNFTINFRHLPGTQAAIALAAAGRLRHRSVFVSIWEKRFCNLQGGPDCCCAGHTPEQVIEYVKSRVPAKDRSRVQAVRVDKRQASSHISPSSGPHFQLISRVIRETMGRPEVLCCSVCSASAS